MTSIEVLVLIFICGTIRFGLFSFSSKILRKFLDCFSVSKGHREVHVEFLFCYKVLPLVEELQHAYERSSFRDALLLLVRGLECIFLDYIPGDVTEIVFV